MKKIPIIIALFIVSMGTCIGRDIPPMPGSANSPITQDEVDQINQDYMRFSQMRGPSSIRDDIFRTDWFWLLSQIEEGFTFVREALVDCGRGQLNPLKLPGLPYHLSGLFAGMRVAVLFLYVAGSHSIIDMSQSRVVYALGITRGVSAVFGVWVADVLYRHCTELQESLGLSDYSNYDTLSLLFATLYGYIFSEALLVDAIFWAILAINQLEFMCYLLQHSCFF